MMPGYLASCTELNVFYIQIPEFIELNPEKLFLSTDRKQLSDSLSWNQWFIKNVVTVYQSLTAAQYGSNKRLRAEHNCCPLLAERKSMVRTVTAAPCI